MLPQIPLLGVYPALCQGWCQGVCKDTIGGCFADIYPKDLGGPLKINFKNYLGMCWKIMEFC